MYYDLNGNLIELNVDEYNIEDITLPAARGNTLDYSDVLVEQEKVERPKSAYSRPKSGHR